MQLIGDKQSLVYFLFCCTDDAELCDNDYQLLNDQQLSGTIANFNGLLDLIEPRHGLVAKLYAVGVITRSHKDYIEAGDRDYKVNKRLLKMLMRRSVADFNKFLECLSEYQSYLMPMFQDGCGKQFYIYYLSFKLYLHLQQ